MPAQLPIDAESPNYRLSTTLDGQSVIFDLRWNSREEAWFLNLLDNDETPIVEGIKVILGMFLGRRTTSERMLPGRLVVEDLSGQNLDATIDDLGTRVIIYYFTEAELEAELDE